MARLDTEVVIVGAGIAGCAAALRLRQRGVSVVVIEKGFAGAQASGVNFGGVRQNGRHLAEIPLARRARAIWPRLGEIVGSDCEFMATGHLKLGLAEAHVAELEDYVDEARAHGLAVEMLSGGEVRQRFPWFSDTVAGASWCAEDGHANPRLVGPAFARAARAAGADIRERCEAVAFRHDGEHFTLDLVADITEREPAGVGHELRARRLINTAGAWGGAIAEAFGEPVPMTAMAPQMVVTEPLPYFIEPVLGICGAGIYLRQIPRGNVIFGAGRGIADTVASRSYVLPEATLEAGAMAIELIPALAPWQIIRVWTGIEGEIPDGIPVIGPSRTTPGLFHAFGFTGHGFQLGPAVGEILAELVLDGATPTPIDAFDIGRFASEAAD